ncbi:MAG: MoxR family ATPase [Dehalococcoidia bacterium]|nr:MoxR family ATPase [Dehalococcoidia bacterium]MBF8303739.1 MoxR family ATPase [Dehalococcoidia bacterium]MDO8635753.1 MoxR family ATPase [Dehalococcoidia bacterium]
MEQSLKNEVERALHIAERILTNVQKVIIGKYGEGELALMALICQGHLLIEDVPGVGKTMLAKSIAKSVGCSFKRIQFTPDILPSDITGVSMYNQKTGDFEFRPGPIMAQIVLADEINRASPKTQSALLECMEERQITVDGLSHAMPRPFMVMATQNPIEYEGTFPLPETQLDRFMLRLSLGYPSAADEITIIEKQQFVHPIDSLDQVADTNDLIRLQDAAKQVHVDTLVKEYIVSLVEATRKHPSIYLGASPRGSLSLFRLSQARALLEGRDYALPDDIKNLAEPTLAHRLIVNSSARIQGNTGRTVVAEILESVPVPGARPLKN